MRIDEVKHENSHVPEGERKVSVFVHIFCKHLQKNSVVLILLSCLFLVVFSAFEMG